MYSTSQLVLHHTTQDVIMTVIYKILDLRLQIYKETGAEKGKVFRKDMFSYALQNHLENKQSALEIAQQILYSFAQVNSTCTIYNIQ